MGTKHRDIQELVKVIGRYLTKNPHASDSLSGIQRWWLGRASSGELPDLVEAALTWLVQRGEVERIEVHGGEPIYRAVRHATTKANGSQANGKRQT